MTYKIAYDDKWQLIREYCTPMPTNRINELRTNYSSKLTCNNNPQTQNEASWPRRNAYLLRYAKEFRKPICEYCLRQSYNLASEVNLTCRKSIVIMALL